MRRFEEEIYKSAHSEVELIHNGKDKMKRKRKRGNEKGGKRRRRDLEFKK